MVQKINQKFGTNFDIVDMAQANQLIPPQGERENVKNLKKQEFNQELNTCLLEQATAVYEKFKRFSEQN